MNKRILEKINESADVNLYKKLLDILGEYTDNFPGTGISGLLDQVIDKGKGVIPSDKLAKSIIDYMLKNDNKSEVVQKMLNIRFSNLPVSLQPRYKDGRKTVTAFWTRNNIVGDKVLFLLNLDSGKGRWTDEQGNAVSLIGDK